MTPELTELTLETYRALVATGRKIEPVSEPLSTLLSYGRPIGGIRESIKLVATDYRDANAFMAGLSRQTDSGLVTPFVVYKILKQGDE